MKVSVIVVIYNNKKWINPVLDAIFAQTHKDLEVFAVVSVSNDGEKELVAEKYPQVKIIDPGKNLGFAGANNLAIRASSGEFIQLVNPDLVLEPDYIEELVKAFGDPKVAAATGKLLRYNFEKKEKTNIIDSTGITISASGRARDRGQNQIDHGQFDEDTNVVAITGAAPMYRKSALEKIKYHDQYFDEDFFTYWEDVDLSWRFNNAGLKNIYVPGAIAYHGRTAGQSTGGYLHLWKFIQHHKKLNKQILRWNYKNHILMYVKNGNLWQPFFWAREIAMLGYIIVFETSTLKVLPELFHQLPKIWAKRKTQQ